MRWRRMWDDSMWRRATCVCDGVMGALLAHAADQSVVDA